MSAGATRCPAPQDAERKRAVPLSWTMFAVIALTAGACSHWRDRGTDGTAGSAAYDNQTSLDKAPASTTDR